MQKIVADKTERHFNVKLKDLMKEEEEETPSAEKKDEVEATPEDDKKKENDNDDWIPQKPADPVMGM